MDLFGIESGLSGENNPTTIVECKLSITYKKDKLTDSHSHCTALSASNSHFTCTALAILISPKIISLLGHKRKYLPQK